jgi:predicted DNA-binding transcriptional regulator YafY
LALKEHKDRWYAVAKDLKDDIIKSFALDRLTNLEITKAKYTEMNFNVEDYFKHCFGIIRPEDEKPEEVILSFDPHQAKYIKSLPLHESQQIIEENENETVFRLKVFITHDFVMEILSYGETVKIIEPQNLISAIKGIYNETLKQY